MRWIMVIGWTAALAGCAPPLVERPSPAAYPSARHAAPTTRLVLPGGRAHVDRDCEHFVDRAGAQQALRGAPGDPDRLDADHDGIACEKLR